MTTDDMYSDLQKDLYKGPQTDPQQNTNRTNITGIDQVADDAHLDPDDKVRVRVLVQYMLRSVDDNCDCDTCGGRLECLAERVINGLPLEPGMEQLQLHLQHCASCREEYDALVRVVVAQNCGDC